MSLEEAGVNYLSPLFNKILAVERMPDEWRKSTLIPIYMNKGDAQDCGNYRGVKLMSHTMKLWKRVVESRLRSLVPTSNEQSIWFYTREEHQ